MLREWHFRFDMSNLNGNTKETRPAQVSNINGSEIGMFRSLTVRQDIDKQNSAIMTLHA